MTSEEFIQACFDGGYVSRKDRKRLKEWLERHPKESYTEDDFIDVYRYFQMPRPGDYVSNSKWTYHYDGHKTTKHYYGEDE